MNNMLCNQNHQQVPNDDDDEKGHVYYRLIQLKYRDTEVFLNILISHSHHRGQDTFQVGAVYFQVTSSPGFSSLKTTEDRKLHKLTPRATLSLNDLLYEGQVLKCFLSQSNIKIVYGISHFVLNVE